MFNHHDNIEERTKKIEKEFNEFMIQFDAAKKEFENYLADNQIDIEEVKERLSNKENFTESEWDYIQEKRNEFEQMNELLNQQYAPPKSQSSKPKDIQPTWIFCR